MTRKSFLELHRYFGGIVRTRVINNDDFIFKPAVEILDTTTWSFQILNLLLHKGVVQEPNDNWQVFALIKRWQNDRVFVLDSHCYWSKMKVGDGSWSYWSPAQKFQLARAYLSELRRDFGWRGYSIGPMRWLTLCGRAAKITSETLCQ